MIGKVGSRPIESNRVSLATERRRRSTRCSIYAYPGSGSDSGSCCDAAGASRVGRVTATATATSTATATAPAAAVGRRLARGPSALAPGPAPGPGPGSGPGPHPRDRRRLPAFFPLLSLPAPALSAR
eukprot:29974-Pelagococcus_subviridis.AAC.4